MRSLILVVVTTFVLAMGALVYFWVQPSHKHSGSRQSASTTQPRIRHSDPGLGVSEGDHVAVKKYDPRTGELASEFLAEEYTPRRGGLIDVKNATARFYLAGHRRPDGSEAGQIIELHGDTGTFRSDMPQEGKRKGFTEARAGTPDRGQLKTVTVTIIETIGDEKHATTRPSMVISMDNAAFDSENATIVTEAYTDPITHQVVAADEVPVTVRSPDTNPNGYDFDGRGMKMLWNERDHRLTSLDVIHGERLIIKNPKNVTDSKSPAAPKTNMAHSRASEGIRASEMASLDLGPALLAAETPTPVVPARRRPRPAATAPAPVVAATEPAATQPAAVARRGSRHRPYAAPPPVMPKIAANVEPPVYRAEFHDNVRIVQNDQTMAVADRMFVDFWMQSGGDEDQSAATTQPGAATQPGHKPHAATLPQSADAATQPATRAVAVVAPTTRPATQPTTRTADEAPIYIYWTGPLHVAPHSEVALTAHESIVTLEGAPVVARQQSSEILASRLIYRTEDGSLKAASTPNSIVTLNSTDAQGKSTIHTTGLEYYAHSQPPTAILTGRSTAQLPMQAGGAMMNAAWTERCALRFEALPDGKSAIKEADLTGNVHVDHPQIKLDSQRLELAFASPATRPTRAVATTTPSTQPASLSQTDLKQLVASDNVHCVMIDSEKKTQVIDTDRLTLLTEPGPDGKLVPRTVNADGAVHAVDDEKDLHSNHLAVTLAPSTRPTSAKAQAAAATQPGLAGNVDLESLIAQGSVHVIGKKDNSQAFADTMLIDKRLGKTNVKLVGSQPGAKIIDKNNTVIGPIIDIASEDQILAVDGGGEMIGTQQDHPGEASKPMHVTWMRNMRIDGLQNVVNAYGNVIAKTTEEDGTVRTVQGEHAKLILVDIPTTQPTTRPTTGPTTAVASTGPSTRPDDVTAPMAHKQIRQAIFEDDAHVNSLLSDAEGLPVKRMRMDAAMIQYDVLATATTQSSTGAQVPMKRITVAVPGKMLVEDYSASSTQPAPVDTATGGMNSRGATAFKWDKSLIYDEAAHRVTMSGSVVIDHRDDVYKEESMHITGDTVIADIDSTPAPPKSATAPATTKPASTQPSVKNVIVRDHVHVNMKGGELVASWIEYSPVTRILIAHGTADTDAVFTRNVPPPTTAQSTKSNAALGGTQPIRALELQWDAGSDLPKITRGNATFRR